MDIEKVLVFIMLNLNRFIVTASQHSIHVGPECIFSEECGGTSCVNGYCDCGKLRKDIIFDRLKRRCSKVSGVACSSLDPTPCLSNAFCDQETLECTCYGQNSSATSHGQCKLNYGVACGKMLPSCNPEKFLRCNIERNACTCANDDEQIYDPDTDSCLTKPGEPCEIYEYGVFPKCVSHSTCVNHFSDSADFGICTCLEPYIQKDYQCVLENPSEGNCNDFSRCPVELGYICSTNSTNGSQECCKNGICLKEDKFGSKSTKRIIKANDFCNEEDSDVCVRHAVCVDGFCQCTSSYNSTMNGQCQLPYGSQCLLEDTKCNEDAHLQCLENICNCTSHQIFNPWTKSCYTSSLIETCNVNNCITPIQCLKYNNTFDGNKYVCKCNDHFGNEMYTICGSEVIMDSSAGKNPINHSITENGSDVSACGVPFLHNVKSRYILEGLLFLFIIKKVYS